MKRQLQLAVLAAAICSASITADARDTISVVGSSTVYPFATVVAERFGNSSKFKTPKIESTGSGGGLKLFCAGAGVNHPDITNASRRIKPSELAMCASNGINEVIEVQVGFDGIVIANSKEAGLYQLSRKDIFLALAKDIPNPKGCDLSSNPKPYETCLVSNPHKTWKDVNPALPDAEIEVLGPPPTSGTRDAFAELAMEGGCKAFPWIKEIKAQSKQAKKDGDKDLASKLKSRYKGICHTVREDGRYIEAGENDNLIVQKLVKNPYALGVFGFSFLEQNEDKVQGAKIEGNEPTFESIADKSYPISRPLYFYVKKAHIGVIPGLAEYLKEFTNDRAWGEDGYLADKGMIPLSEELRAKYANAAANLVVLTPEDLQ